MLELLNPPFEAFQSHGELAHLRDAQTRSDWYFSGLAIGCMDVVPYDFV